MYSEQKWLPMVYPRELLKGCCEYLTENEWIMQSLICGRSTWFRKQNLRYATQVPQLPMNARIMCTPRWSTGPVRFFWPLWTSKQLKTCNYVFQGSTLACRRDVRSLMFQTELLTISPEKFLLFYKLQSASELLCLQSPERLQKRWYR